MIIKNYVNYLFCGFSKTKMEEMITLLVSVPLEQIASTFNRTKHSFIMSQFLWCSNSGVVQLGNLGVEVILVRAAIT